MAAVKFSDLVAYFESLATKHVDINNSPEEDHFYRYELDDVLAGISKDLNYPALILEGYDLNYKDEKSDNLQKTRNGAFILLGYVGDSGDHDKIHDTWDFLEEIGEELVLKIKADKRDRSIKVVRDFDLNDVDGTLLAIEETGHYGIRFSYGITSARSKDLNPDKWK